MKPAARAAAFVAAAGTFCAASVFAEESATTPPQHSTSNSVRVVVDPDTRAVRAPTAEELKALIEAENAARASARTSARAAAAAAPTQVLPAERQIVRHANGMVSVQLSQESLSLVKAGADANGKVRTVHGTETVSGLPQEEK
jgi:hypothetical protein